jgi:hypothetical protein
VELTPPPPPQIKIYTLCNNQSNPVLAKLDRIFVTTGWEAAMPLVRVITLPKDISDHNPLLVDFGYDGSFGKKKFRFEKWWMERAYFRDIVFKAWDTTCQSKDPMEIL